MSCNIIPTRRFEKEIKRLVKKYPSLKNEFAKLISTLNDRPEYGTHIGHNCYKIRLGISSKGKGKRGGARIVTHLFLSIDKIEETAVEETFPYSTTSILPQLQVYLLTIYDKSEKEDLKPNELKEIIEGLEL
jgi:mRNA-degrading endonuclease RelE of RelBE toxin-antitoxin system